MHLSDELVQCVPTKKGHQILFKGYTYVFKSRLQCGAEQWICSFRQKTAETEATQLPEWTSIYFTKVSDNETKCNLCDITLKLDEKSLELLKHMKTDHKDIYDLHKDNPEATVGFRIEFLHLNMLKDDGDPKTQPVILGEVCKAASVTEPVENIEVVTTKGDYVDIQNMKYVLIDEPKKQEGKHTVRRKRSWVWKYFDKLSNIIYRCKFCNVILSIKGCNSNNMNRHIRTRHPTIFQKEVTKGDYLDNGNYVMNDSGTPFAIKTEEIYSSDRDEETTDTSSKKVRPSWIWKYFDRVSRTQAQCKLCKRQISHGGNATGNMNRHLKIIHNTTADVHDWVWKVFGLVDKDCYACKICQFRCTKYSDEDMSCILQHLKSEHGVVSGDQIITGADV